MSDGRSPRAFAVQRFKPDGGFELPGLLLLLGVLGGVGLVLGGVATYLSQWVYLVLLFPTGIGVALGGVGAAVLRRTHFRNPWLGGAAGLIGGIFAMAMMHYSAFATFKHNVAKTLPQGADAFLRRVAADPGKLADSTADPRAAAQLRDLLSIHRATQSLPAFLELQARQGVSLKRGTGSGQGINLGYVGSYLYWGLEVLLVAGIVFWMLRAKAGMPYCPACRTWQASSPLGFLKGSKDEAKRAVASGDLAQWEALDPSTDRDARDNIVTLFHCEACAAASPVVVRLEHVSWRKREQRVSTVAREQYPAAAKEPLQQLFSSASAPTT